MMLAPDWEPYKNIYAIDFEYYGGDGENPNPICMVVKELRAGSEIRFWHDQLDNLSTCPIDTGSDSVYLAYYSSAEMNCFLALKWQLPKNVIDLYSEFRNLTNGKSVPHGRGLFGALAYFDIDSLSANEKEEMRRLALRGGPWTEHEKAALLEYCASDVYALEKLFLKMNSFIEVGRALLRGSYTMAAAQIETVGVPIDVVSLARLKDNWSAIHEHLIQRFSQHFDFYDGKSFKEGKFADWLERQKISWPKHPSGHLKLDNSTFSDMAKTNTVLASIHELRTTLSRLRLNDLAIGSDNRNRTLLSYLSSKTGRNQPSNSKSIFGLSKWIRSLIKPELGFGLAYIDWSQQEFGIAAALSGDEKMMAAYRSGDPYLAFAIQAKAAPENATKESHGKVRNLFKQCSLAVQYGMGAESLAIKIGKPDIYARELLRLHRETYAKFWAWSDAVSNYAMAFGHLTTTFGWNISIGEEPNDRSIRNFPMQANGAEMLRLTCVRAASEGIKICLPVHDAILIEAPQEVLAEHIAKARQIMNWASDIVLDGFTLSTDVQVIESGERFMDERGQSFWDSILEIVNEIEGAQKCTQAVHI